MFLVEVVYNTPCQHYSQKASHKPDASLQCFSPIVAQCWQAFASHLLSNITELRNVLVICVTDITVMKPAVAAGCCWCLPHTWLMPAGLHG